MRQIFNFRMVCSAAVLVAALGLGGTKTADAGNNCYHCKYVKVMTYKTEIKPYYKWIVVEDEYGCEHRVKKVCYRKVKVPVVKYVKVCH